MDCTEALPTAPALLPDHRDELHRSGLTDGTIAAAGIFSGNGEIRDLLGWMPKPLNVWGDGWVIPYRDQNGAETGYARVKLDNPRRDDHGKPVKYEAPLNKESRAYFPPGFTLADATTLIITEGEKKALAAMQAGFATISISGVYSWQRRRPRSESGRAYGPREMIPDLAGIDWKGREVFIAFDSDAAEKAMVRLAEFHLAEALRQAGATVKIVRLPAIGDDKVGLDDFLLAKGADGPADLRHLMATAEEPKAPPPPSFMDWARLWLDDKWTSPNGRTIRSHQNGLYVFDGRRYIAVPNSELVAELLLWLDDHSGPAKPKIATEIVTCVSALVRVPFDAEMPVWLGQSGPEAKDWIPLENGLLDISPVDRGEVPVLRPHTPKWFSVNLLPHRYDPEAECPAWFGFLTEVFDGDVERVNLLGQWFGLCLTADTRYQAIVMLVGPRRSGKGTVLRALERLIGKHNCVSPRLGNLDAMFGLQGLLGKRVAMFPDAHLGHGDKALGILEVLKSISGEDSLEVHRKFKMSVTTRLPIRFMLAVNDLPRFGDSAGALSSRLLILPFFNSYEGREDRHLDDKLAMETSGILNWAIEGLARLRQTGGFVRPTTSERIRREFERLASPVTAFLEDQCVIEASAEVDTTELWTAWRSWCEASGHHAGSKESLGSRLRTLVPRLDAKQYQELGTRKRKYIGIGIRPE